ncbi:unnamed protein product [Lepeophtheirus salmonis]|uniref:(salmon louse) hypothetical protein n=1 Tax=Lepeophtheirus salmonis TaxID=72036 RepID=A0A7R8H6Q7_LEPSM|nr:unnamed protein product [Lepeophtheirus salmonis]CAF2903946.1 unnamed protein product [Lepeophtheirus salmonis]
MILLICLGVNKFIEFKMSLKAVRFVAHCGSVLNFIYSINFQWNLVIPKDINDNRSSFGGAWKFLTFWNLWVQCLMSIFCLLDILAQEFLRKHFASRIRFVRDYYFTSVGFPVGLFVGLMFWGLWWINRELVMPKIMDPYIPVGLITTSLFCVAYLAWICYIAHAGGYWVYPIMEILPPLQRGLFMTFSVLLLDLFYFLGDILNDFVWEDTVPPHIKRFQKKKAKKYD